MDGFDEEEYGNALEFMSNSPVLDVFGYKQGHKHDVSPIANFNDLSNHANVIALFNERIEAAKEQEMHENPIGWAKEQRNNRVTPVVFVMGGGHWDA
jgi:hypothetical protein